MSELPFGPPYPLSALHQTQEFDCGQAPLNEFLQRYALTNAQSGNARTFVVADEEYRAVGYYSLAATAIVHDAAPMRVQQGQPRHPIPAILMARFAVDRGHQRQGLGRELFRDALLRSLNIADELGARAFVVDAKDEATLRFYNRFEMIVVSQNPHRLYLLFKDIKNILAG